MLKKFNLRTKLILILLLVFLPFVFTMGNSFKVLQDLNGDGVSINTSGSQRMRPMLLANYSQQYVKAINESNTSEEQLVREVLEVEVEKYDKIMTGLENGDSELNLPLLKNDTIKSKLNSIESQVSLYSEAVKNLIEKTDVDANITYITANALVVKNEIHALVGEYQIAYDGKISSFKTSMLIFLVIGLVTLLLSLRYLIKSIIKPVKNLTGNLENIATGNVDFKDKMIIDSSDEIAMMSKSYNDVIYNIEKQANIISSIAEGDLDFKIEVRSENDILNIKLEEAVANLVILDSEIKELTNGINEGNWDVRAKSHNLKGQWSVLIKELNYLVEAFVKPLDMTTSYLTKLGDGNIPAIINDNYPGDFNKIKLSINDCINSINWIVEDTTKLTTAAISGDFETRIDSSRHNGEYKNITDGLNNTIGAVVEPINEAIDVLKEFSKGNLNVSVTGDYQGEHAVIKDSINGTLSNVRGYIKEITKILSYISSGDLTKNIEVDFIGDYKKIEQALLDINDSLNEVFSEFKESSSQVAIASDKVSDSAEKLSLGAREQNREITTIRSSISEITEKTNVNTENAFNANNLSSKAQESARNGNSSMKDLSLAISEISVSSKNISSIIKVIDEIAFQTNILALNAAVEAARAGEHGKGFAVVAEEVRNLAARSADAAKETTVLIEDSILKIEKGVETAGITEKALDEIVESITESSKIVDEIAKSSEEQSKSLNDINSGITQVSIVTEDNTKTAEQSASASEEMSSQADILSKRVARFKLREYDYSRDNRSNYDLPVLDDEEQPSIQL